MFKNVKFFNFWFVFFVFGFLFLILASAYAVSPYPIYYPLSGKISGPEGVPLGGRTIRFYKTTPDAGVATAITNDDGSFTIQVFDIWPDNVVIGVDYIIDSPSQEGYGINPVQAKFITGYGYDEVPAGVSLMLTSEVFVPGLARITGTVKDVNDNPVKDALVKANSKQVATDSYGAYNIINLPPGTYTVTATKAGYLSTSEVVPVASGETKVVNFVLVPTAVPTQFATAKIEVAVTDAGLGVPIADVDVEIIGGERGRSDASGMISFVVTPGSYQIRARKQYYIPQIITVSVASGEVKKVDIPLKLSTPPTITRVRFGERLYQPALVAKGEKFVVTPNPRITATLTNEPDSGIASTTLALTVDRGTSASKKYDVKDLTASVVKSQSVAGVNRVSELAVKFEVPETAQLTEGEHTIEFFVENDYGLSSSYIATVEVLGGPLRLVSPPLTYPSPFSIRRHGTVTIQYGLSADADIEIYITDVSGQRVKRFLLDAGTEGGSAGINKITWDGITAMGTRAGNAIYVGTIIARKEGRLLGKFKLTIVD